MHSIINLPLSSMVIPNDRNRSQMGAFFILRVIA